MVTVTSPAEQILSDATLTDRMLATLEVLVTTESPSADVSACENCAEVLLTEVNAWLPWAGELLTHRGRPVLRWGAPKPRILLLGHFDTVWPIGTLTRLPWSVTGDRVRGPGVFDMKAGIVQGLAAVAALAEPEQNQIGILLTCDEEIGSGTSRDLIEAVARDADAVFVLEPSVEGEVKSSRKGTSWYELLITGRAAHAGLEPEKGINALTEAAAFITATTGWGDAATATTVTATTARAGVTDNTVPDKAVIGVDARAWTFAEQQRVDDLIRGWQLQHPEATLEVVAGGINRPAMPISPELVQRALALATQLGLNVPGHRAVGGGSDGNFTAALGVPTLDGLGAVGEGAHADHEWASVEGMRERAALVAALMNDYLRDSQVTA